MLSQGQASVLYMGSLRVSASYILVRHPFGYWLFCFLPFLLLPGLICVFMPLVGSFENVPLVCPVQQSTYRISTSQPADR